MRLPIPNNRLVAFTLAGALLTALVAGGLAFPGLLGGSGPGDASDGGAPAASPQTTDVPTPNPDFTPAVQTQRGYEDEHEDEEHEADEHEDEEHGEYEGGEEE